MLTCVSHDITPFFSSLPIALSHEAVTSLISAVVRVVPTPQFNSETASEMAVLELSVRFLECLLISSSRPFNSLMEAVLKSDWKDEESFDAGVDDSVASTVFLTVDVVCSVVLPAAIEAVVVSALFILAV